MIQPDNIAAYLLAGGKSSRMGFDKGLLPFGESTFAAHSVAVLEEVFGEATIIANQAIYKLHFKQVIPDRIPNQGPIGGICTAITHASKAYCFVMSCDMPLLSVEAVRHFLAQADEGCYMQIAVCAARSFPLPGLYHHSILPNILQQIEAGERKLMHLFEQNSGQYIDMNFYSREFLNINTPDDYLNLLKHT